MKRTLAVLIENKPGALARIVGLFHQRGYNIDSLNVAPVFDGSYSRIRTIEYWRNVETVNVITSLME